MSDHLLHQFHCRMILTGVFLSFGLHHHFVQHDIIRSHPHIQVLGDAGNYIHHFCYISHRRKGEFIPAFTGFDLIISIIIGNTSYAFSFIKD